MSEMALFEERPVRWVFHDVEWWFVLTDIVSALTDSPAPSDYLKKLRRRDPSLAEAFKGGDNLSPPLRFPSKRRAERKGSSAGMSQEFSG
jgi:prophage antirepressor-like protein